MAKIFLTDCASIEGINRNIEKYTTLGILKLTRKEAATQLFSRPLGFLAIEL